MNLEHKEKQLIFDEYAKEQGFEGWYHLHLSNDYDGKLIHEMNATDLIQKKALERASDNTESHIICQYGCDTLVKDLVTNENNLIK